MRMKALGVRSWSASPRSPPSTGSPMRPAARSSPSIRDEELLEFGQSCSSPMTRTPSTSTSTTAPSPGSWPTSRSRSRSSCLRQHRISFSNETGATVTVTGTGTTRSSSRSRTRRLAPVKFDDEGETTVTAVRHRRSLTSSPILPHSSPMGPTASAATASRARAASPPVLRASTRWRSPNKWAQTGGAQSLNNYVSWVITLGGIVRSGQIDSEMPAWGQEYGGSAHPPADRGPDRHDRRVGGRRPWPTRLPRTSPTPSRPAPRFTRMPAASPAMAPSSRAVGPNLQTIGGTRLVTDGLPTPSRRTSSGWRTTTPTRARSSSSGFATRPGTTTTGTPTGMPAFHEIDLSESGSAGPHHVPAGPDRMTTYALPRRRGLFARLIGEGDDFATWLLFGAETWLIATLKAVPCSCSSTGCSPTCRTRSTTG